MWVKPPQGHTLDSFNISQRFRRKRPRKYPNRGWATTTSKGRSVVVHRRMVTVPRYVVPRHWSILLTVRIRRWSRRPPSTVVSEMDVWLYLVAVVARCRGETNGGCGSGSSGLGGWMIGGVGQWRWSRVVRWGGLGRRLGIGGGIEGGDNFGEGACCSVNGCSAGLTMQLAMSQGCSWPKDKGVGSVYGCSRPWELAYPVQAGDHGCTSCWLLARFKRPWGAQEEQQCRVPKDWALANNIGLDIELGCIRF
ncbi:hypothetical protein GQ457_01G034200 [Hibiscus cannabinus]